MLPIKTRLLGEASPKKLLSSSPEEVRPPKKTRFLRIAEIYNGVSSGTDHDCSRSASNCCLLEENSLCMVQFLFFALINVDGE